MSAGRATKESRKDGTLGLALFDTYGKREKALSHLREMIVQVVDELGMVIVAVDELDRCRPDYAISYLETLHHVFDIEGLVFVLGVDRQMLKSSAYALFGSQLDFDEYYRKFAHRQVDLPEPTVEVRGKFIRELVGQYLDSKLLQEKGRFCRAKCDQYRVNDLIEVVSYLRLAPRQVHEMFRILTHVLSCPQERKGNMLWTWNVAVLFLVAVSLGDRELYHRLGRAEIGNEDFLKRLVATGFLKREDRSSQSWISIVALANHRGSEEEGLVALIESHGVFEEENAAENIQAKLDSIGGPSGFDLHAFVSDRKPTIFGIIYGVIEELTHFEVS